MRQREREMSKENKKTVKHTHESEMNKKKYLCGCGYRGYNVQKALDKEHVDDDNDRHMIKSMHGFYVHQEHINALLCQLPACSLQFMCVLCCVLLILQINKQQKPSPAKGRKKNLLRFLFIRH